MNNLLQYARNMKVQMLSLLTVLLVFAIFARSGSVEPSIFFIQLAAAIAVAVSAEFAIFGSVKTTSTQSAVITGTIIALLLAPGTDLKLIWFAVFAAIASKAVFQLPAGRHIFNPAASGLFLTTIFFGNRINWWGFSNPYVVIIFGGIILYRLNRLSLVFSYIIFRCIGVIMFGGFHFSLESLMLYNLFFAFIMLIEPMTSAFKRKEQWLFGGAVGILSSFFFATIPSYGGDITALLCMNYIHASGLLKKFSTLRQQTFS